MTAGNKLTGGTAIVGALDFKGGASAPRTIVLPLTATTSTTAGDVLSWANPEGQSILVTSAILDVTTASTGAASLDIGPAANATTNGDTLFDAMDVNAAAGVFTYANDAGANGVAHVKVSSTQYINAKGTASTAGLVANLHLSYVLVPT